MKKLRKRVFLTAGYNTVSMGTGRKEFNPKKKMPGLEHYMKEAGQASIAAVGGAQNIDECVVGNFMSARFNKQAHLGAFMPMIDEGLRYKPAVSVEGACASGGLALLTGIRSVLAETADMALVIGVEVQNTLKAIYGADVLAGAGWFPKRKEGHAYFFPGQFSNRAGAYFEKYGRDYTRKGFARWYRNAIENARLCSTAQEYENKVEDLEKLALSEPMPAVFTDYLNVFDCSKVSDGASSIIVASEEGLEKAGIPLSEAIEIIGWGQAEDDLTKEPDDPTRLSTMAESVKQALASANITINELATIELHDCFTIAGILAMEAIGFAKQGEGAKFVAEGHTARNGKIPVNTTGGLVGWGHPTGATGVHMAVTIWEQLTGKAGKSQIEIPADRPYGLSVNMGGDDKSLVAIVYRKAT
ncbi:MAG: 3-ketoacyl-CoA thiolase [Bacteroidales bacterium]|nr:3-ketoacyl-CoA thiolase [Bacteroidales bacterium]